MGRIGRSYPRFEEAQQPAQQGGSLLPEEREGVSGYQVVGAIIGILSALGLIGWFLTR
jgi:hypothetical protein